MLSLIIMSMFSLGAYAETVMLFVIIEFALFGIVPLSLMVRGMDKPVRDYKKQMLRK